MSLANEKSKRRRWRARSGNVSLQAEVDEGIDMLVSPIGRSEMNIGRMERSRWTMKFMIPGMHPATS
jgi:hypothetical protein